MICFTMTLIKAIMAKKSIQFNYRKNVMSVMIFDDIQDDTFFKDIVIEYDFNFKVFKFENKLLIDFIKS